ncbi:hypothetical protein ACWC1D_25640 [Streptomyces sp. NPDC001478]
MLASPMPEDPQNELSQWLNKYGQLRVGDETWAYRSFADMVAEHGSFFAPAPWPMRHPQTPGRCFAAASEWSDRTGWAYAEGYVLVPSAVPFTVFEHAWCLTDEGKVADPALPDGLASGYLGIPITGKFRCEQQRSRNTKAVFVSDPINPLAGVNEKIFLTGLPPWALATGVTTDGVEGKRNGEGFPRR